MKTPRLLAGLVPAALFVCTVEIDVVGEERGYPEGVREISFVSSGDDTKQPALFWAPKDAQGPVPLLVGLHTWSSNFRQRGGEVVYAEWCQLENWAFLHPDFRGPNRTPEAMGSDLVIADVASAVSWAQSETSIDPDRIYVVGVSGGGHAAMLVAARLPDLWAGVSAWCGISDISRWHKETAAAGRKKYAEDIEKALGGAPLSGTREGKDAEHRSPETWLQKAGAVSLDIHHGINDGRSGSVPFSQSLRAWNRIVPEKDRFLKSEIDSFYQFRNVPDELHEYALTGSFPLYGEKSPLFQRTSNSTRITIFNGGHEIVHNVALNWLAAQRKGQPAVWQIEVTRDLDTQDADSKSGL